MKTISERHILFIGIGFYDYESAIVERLEELGVNVYAFAESPAYMREGLLAGMIRRAPRLSEFLARRHEQMILRSISGIDFDQVIIIKASGLSVEFLERLTNCQPHAEFILYQWDSLARVPGVQKKLPMFDRVLTFDRLDALRNPSLQFRPLFYRVTSIDPGYERTNLDIDIIFVGLIHSDRLPSIRKIQKQAQEAGLNSFVYLYTGIVTWLKLICRGEARDVHLRPLPYKTLLAKMRRSKCVIDLPHAAQCGLTMRAIEALGMGKKLLTTGKDIKHYDFYLPTNIKILEVDNLRISREFIFGPTTPVSDVVRVRYSLDAWIGDLLGMSNEDFSPSNNIEPI